LDTTTNVDGYERLPLFDHEIWSSKTMLSAKAHTWELNDRTIA